MNTRAPTVVLMCFVLASSLIALLLWFLALTDPGATNRSSPLRFAGSQFTPAVPGDARIVADDAVFESLTDGVAVLSKNVSIDADDYAVFSIDLRGVDVRAQAHVYWRKPETPGHLYYAALTSRIGSLYTVPLSAAHGWQGRISEISVGISAQQLAEPVTLASLTLVPAGAPAMRWALLDDWFGFRPMGFVDVNHLGWMTRASSITPSVFALAAVVLASAIVLLLNGGWRGLSSQLLLCFVCAWLVLDIRWQWNLIQQRQHSEDYYRYDLRSHSPQDGALRSVIEQLKNSFLLPGSGSPVLWISDKTDNSYLAFRARYHAQPQNVRILYSWHRVDFLERARAGDLMFEMTDISPWVLDSGQSRLQAWGVCVPVREKARGGSFRLFELSSAPFKCDS